MDISDKCGIDNKKPPKFGTMIRMPPKCGWCLLPFLTPSFGISFHNGKFSNNKLLFLGGVAKSLPETWVRHQNNLERSIKIYIFKQYIDIVLSSGCWTCEMARNSSFKLLRQNDCDASFLLKTATPPWDASLLVMWFEVVLEASEGTSSCILICVALT